MKHLTKSGFKLALECPTKLYYDGLASEYRNQNEANDFLRGLAEGGHQVGELAKFKYHPDPIGSRITVTAQDPALAAIETRARLGDRGRQVIAEAALQVQAFSIRVDVLIVDHDAKVAEVIEVKSKSVTRDLIGHQFKQRSGGFLTKWRPYLYDIAFQAEVARLALPAFAIRPKLLVLDSEEAVDTTGLHQCFRVRPTQNAAGRSEMLVVTDEGLNRTRLGSMSILTEVDMSEIVAELRIQPISNAAHIPPEHATDLLTFMNWAASIRAKGSRAFHGVSSQCKKCEFRAAAEDPLKSGVHECWQQAMERGMLERTLDPTDRELPLTVDLWSGKSGRISPVEGAFERGRAFLADIQEEDLPKPKELGDQPGLLPYQRRIAQVEAARGGPGLVLCEEVLAEMDRWRWPLHLIDFETSAPAIPFFAGMCPYETLAFQFSHHTLAKASDGAVAITHASQWISTEPNAHPNLGFARALRAALAPNGTIEGTVFRYHLHENTVLRRLRQEIERRRADTPDADELISFILDITSPMRSERRRGDCRRGSHAMVDLHRVVERGYFSARAGGSISLKRVLPAILADAPDTARIFQQPGRYGKGLPMASLNFTDPQGHVWLPNGPPADPYKTLPPVHTGLGEDVDDMLQRFAAKNGDEGDAIDQGGIAMLAYNLTHFTDLTDAGRSAIRDALLRYCELDTLAMAMLILGLMELRGKPLTVSLRV